MDLGIPERRKTTLVVVDIQEKFMPVIFEIDRVVENTKKLVRAFQAMKIPVIFTQQYTKGLGPTAEEIAQLFGDEKPIEKIEFSCMENKEFLKRMKGFGVKDLVICGIEAHVCILQTALDAIKQGFRVYIVQDATSSRNKSDWKTAMRRARQSGAFIVSTEMIIFQLLRKAGTQEFKEIQRIVK
jgi:nicotinamidase-related amidase